MGLQIFDNVNLAQVTFLKVIFYLVLLNSLESKVRGRFKNVPSELSLLLNLDFTLLAVDMPNTAPSDLQPQPVISIIQLFGWDDIIWPQVVARYLSHLLQNRYIPLFQKYSLVYILISILEEFV